MKFTSKVTGRSFARVCLFFIGIHGCVSACYSLMLELAPLLYPAQNGLQIERLYNR